MNIHPIFTRINNQFYVDHRPGFQVGRFQMMLSEVDECDPCFLMVSLAGHVDCTVPRCGFIEGDDESGMNAVTDRVRNILWDNDMLPDVVIVSNVKTLKRGLKIPLHCRTSFSWSWLGEFLMDHKAGKIIATMHVPKARDSTTTSCFQSTKIGMEST